MKYIYILSILSFLFISESLLAQSPQGFNYQAVARDISDEIIKDEFVSIRFWILEDNDTGSPVYRETHQSVYTGVNGVLTLTVGAGSSDVGDFSTIDWGAKDYFIRVDLDANGGSNFSQMGTSRLLSVPFAMYALKSGDGNGGDDWGNQLIQHDATLIGTGTTSDPLSVNTNQVNTDEQILSISGTQLSISNGNTISIPTGGSDADADPTNELQDLSINTSGSDVDLNITDGTGVSFNINDADADPTNEIQELSNTKSGDNVTISISDGNSTTFNVRDGDFSDFNELQSLSLSGNSLSISNGNTVFLPGSTGSLWTENSSSDAIRYPGTVNVGTDVYSNYFSSPHLYVNGYGLFKDQTFPNSEVAINPQGSIGMKNNFGAETVYLGNGRLELQSPLGQGTVDIGVEGNEIILKTGDDKNLIRLTKTSAGGAFIGLTNQFGNNETVRLGSYNETGQGFVSTYFASKVNNVISYSATPEYGGMAIFDGFGDTGAGMYFDNDFNAVVFADIKNFRMAHPEKQGKEIWYASLEGPEAGAYERGTAQLVNGEAIVPYSDHYTLVISEEGMTVMTSPLSAESLGLAVVARTTEGFHVKELYGGTGNYAFDWEVKGVRKGFEDYEVIRDKRELIKTTSGRE